MIYGATEPLLQLCSSVTVHRYTSAAPNLPRCWLIALLIENPSHAGNILGKDKHTLSHFVKKAKQFQFCIFMRTETQSTVEVEVWGEFMLRNRQPKPSLSMHEIS